MNIFYLHPDPQTCAEMHVDKHVVKMIIEYAQLMSTAHRLLDGTQDVEKRYVNGSLPPRYRHIKVWNHPDKEMHFNLMRASHINHPSAVWCRVNDENYKWLSNLWTCLLTEYTFRYGKNHSCEKYIPYLAKTPINIPKGQFFQPTPAMPDEVKIPGDSLASYRNYYINNKKHLASWKIRSAPTWYATT
jgi:hypothetical protein